jgi:hypothetical protein
VVLERIKSDVQGPIGCGYSVRVVPFEVLGDTVPDVDALEEGVIAIKERSSVIVELIRELELLIYTNTSPANKRTTNCSFVPSFDVRVFSDSGVSGSMRPVL